MASIQDNPDAVVLHLSDLHFTSYLQNVSGAIPYLAPKPHDFSVLQEIHAHITLLVKRWQDRCVFVVSGDLTTSGEPGAYETVSTYLRGHVWVSSMTRVGLDLVDQHRMEERLLVVPGNHDIWFDGISSVLPWGSNPDRRALYQHYFGDTYTRAVYPVKAGGISFLFFLLDSNRLADWNPLNVRNALGRGRVGNDQIELMKAEYDGFVREFEDDPIPGFDLDSAVRVGVLHHHLVVPEDDSKLTERLLRLGDAPEVIDLFARHLQVRLVLCGHQHVPFVAPVENGRTWISCAGTSTQFGSGVNSYKVYWVKREGDSTVIEMEEFQRDGKVEPNRRKFVPGPLVRL